MARIYSSRLGDGLLQGVQLALAVPEGYVAVVRTVTLLLESESVDFSAFFGRSNEDQSSTLHYLIADNQVDIHTSYFANGRWVFNPGDYMEVGVTNGASAAVYSLHGWLLELPSAARAARGRPDELLPLRVAHRKLLARPGLH